MINFKCNQSLQYYSGEKPVTPVGIKIKANAGKTFTLYYYVINKEVSFDGYNVYITRQPTGGAVLKSNYPAYTDTGGTPSLVHDNTQTDVNQQRNALINYFVTFNDNGPDIPRNTLIFPFEAGVRYYFKITAHTYFDVESTPSNEVSAVALP